MKKYNQKNIESNNYSKLINNNNIAKNIIFSFLDACQQTFEVDEEIFNACEHQSIIKMEDMVQSKSYFKGKIIKRILNSHIGNDYLNQVFDEKNHINIHNKNSIDPKDYIKLWPSCFKKHFINEYNNSEAKKLYEDYEYKVLDLF